MPFQQCYSLCAALLSLHFANFASVFDSLEIDLIVLYTAKALVSFRIVTADHIDRRPNDSLHCKQPHSDQDFLLQVGHRPPPNLRARRYCKKRIMGALLSIPRGFDQEHVRYVVAFVRYRHQPRI